MHRPRHHHPHPHANGLAGLTAAALLLPACFDVDRARPSIFETQGGSTGLPGSDDDDTALDDSGTTADPPDTDGTTTDVIDTDTEADCVSTDAGITILDPEETAVEGGELVELVVVLDHQPCGTVEIGAVGDSQLETNASVSFTPDDWDLPQPLPISAIHDFEREGDHQGSVELTVASEDPAYDGMELPPTPIAIVDRAHLAHASPPLAGAGTNADSMAPRVSEDGRWVVFLSDASNLETGDSGLHTDAYRRDMVDGTTERLSTGTDGEANGSTTTLDMSADGSVVVLQSMATNLVSPTVDPGEIHQWTEPDGLVALTSPCAGCPCAGCSTAIQPWVSISSNGVYVAYSSPRQLLPSDSESQYDIFTLHRPSGTLTHDSLNGADENGAFFWGSNAFGPILSADGTFMGWSSAAQNLDVPDITVQNFHSYVKNRFSRQLNRISRHHGGVLNCDGVHRATGSGPAFPSADGSVAVFSSTCALSAGAGVPTDQAGFQDVFVRDIAAMTTTRISRGYDGSEADGNTDILDISDDARYLLMRSDATNLVPNDTNGALDLFVHDRQENTTVRVSYDEAYGQLSAGVDDRAAISADGRFVVFATGDALLPSDGNVGVLDVYRVQLR